MNTFVQNVIGELTTTGRFIPYLAPMRREFHEQKQLVVTVYDNYDPGTYAQRMYEQNRQYAEYFRRCGEAENERQGRRNAGKEGRPFFSTDFSGFSEAYGRMESMRRYKEHDDKMDANAYAETWRVKTPEELIKEMNDTIFDVLTKASETTLKVPPEPDAPMANQPWYQKYDKKRAVKGGKR